MSTDGDNPPPGILLKSINHQSVNHQLFIDLLFWLGTQTLELDVSILNPSFPSPSDLALGKFLDLS